MRNLKIIFVHGFTASSKSDWYPSISVELKKKHIDFAIPDMPDSSQPHAKAWLDTLHTEVCKSAKPIVLVGHSLGTRTVLLVAAFANRVENANRWDGRAYPDFFEHEINIAKIKKLVPKFIVMHSKDDSSIPYEQGMEISKDLGAELLTYENRDHFSEQNNMEYVLKVLQNELDFL